MDEQIIDNNEPVDYLKYLGTTVTRVGINSSDWKHGFSMCAKCWEP